MDVDFVRSVCRKLPHVTEQVQWGADLVFKIGGKMYAVMNTEPAEHYIAFKCSEEDFAELCEREGIVPAPYMARMQWVAVEREDTLPRAELKRFVRKAYDLIFTRLPKKTQAALRS